VFNADRLFLTASAHAPCVMAISTTGQHGTDGYYREAMERQAQEEARRAEDAREEKR